MILGINDLSHDATRSKFINLIFTYLSSDDYFAKHRKIRKVVKTSEN